MQVRCFKIELMIWSGTKLYWGVNGLENVMKSGYLKRSEVRATEKVRYGFVVVNGEERGVSDLWFAKTFHLLRLRCLRTDSEG